MALRVTRMFDADVPGDPALFAPHNKFTVVEHRQDGLRCLQSLADASLCFSPEQQRREFVDGHYLRAYLRHKKVLNACFLDALALCLRETESKKRAETMDLLVPPKFWKDANGWHLYTFFWGTLYADPSGRLFVRYLCKVGGVSFGLLGLDNPYFRVNTPAAVWE